MLCTKGRIADNSLAYYPDNTRTITTFMLTSKGFFQRDSVVKDVIQNVKCKIPMHTRRTGAHLCVNFGEKRLSR